MAIICWTSSNVCPQWIYLEKHLRKISVTWGYFGPGTIFVITYTESPEWGCAVSGTFISVITLQPVLFL